MHQFLTFVHTSLVYFLTHETYTERRTLFIMWLPTISKFIFLWKHADVFFSLRANPFIFIQAYTYDATRRNSYTTCNVHTHPSTLNICTGKHLWCLKCFVQLAYLNKSIVFLDLQQSVRYKSQTRHRKKNKKTVCEHSRCLRWFISHFGTWIEEIFPIYTADSLQQNDILANRMCMCVCVCAFLWTSHLTLWLQWTRLSVH